MPQGQESGKPLRRTGYGALQFGQRTRDAPQQPPVGYWIAHSDWPSVPSQQRQSVHVPQLSGGVETR